MNNRNFASIVEEIKELVDPYDFYLSEQNISHFKHSSGDWVEAGLCPFHDDNTPGSFKVNTEIGAFICFSCGQKGGDDIDFIRKKYSLTFSEALSKLKKEWRALMDLEAIKRRKEGYTTHWEYTEYNRSIMIVARYDTDKGKVYHQFSFHEGEWKEGMPQPPYPLFGLDSLVHTSPLCAVAICEGEKCATALHQLNWPAVATVLGASSFHHSDFTPLRHFKQFVILHDNDEPGYAFARGIATEILRIRDDAIITVCNLMPNG